MDVSAVNKGVVDYLAQSGQSVRPRVGQSTVSVSRDELVETVVGLVRESLSIPAHWNTTSPAAGAAIMKREMKRRHAHLDESALEALATNFAAAWR